MVLKTKKSIYCDSVTLNKLRKIAAKQNRSVINQIRHWIDSEIK